MVFSAQQALGKLAEPKQAQSALAQARQRAALIPDLIVEARQIAGSVIHGWHGRRIRGSGDNFWQFRPYMQGDMLSRIDWRRSARDDHTYMRDREWETAHTIWLWADPSASMLYQSRFSNISKQQRALVLTLALAELFSRSGERIAYPSILPPQASRNGAQNLATALIQHDDLPSQPDLSALPAQPELSAIRRFNELVLISDFLTPLEELQAGLAQIAQRGIRAHLIEVADPAEESFPFSGRTEFHDPVTGVKMTTGRAQAYSQDYQRLYLARREVIRDICTRQGWSFITSRTDKPAAQALTTLHGFLSNGRGSM